MGRTRIALVVAVAAVLVTATLAGSAGAVRPETTGVPGSYVTINVKLGDKILTVSRHSSSGVQVIGFRIRNIGKKAHNFIIGDHATNRIAPGQFDDFAVSFNDFGKYLYRCTLNCAHSLRGYINVQRGNFGTG
jgi:plastocyanin